MKRLATGVLVAVLLTACGGASSGSVGGAPSELWQQIGCVEAIHCTPVVAEKAPKQYGGDGSSERGETWCVVIQQNGERHSYYVTQRGGEWQRFIGLKADFADFGCPTASAAAPQ